MALTDVGFFSYPPICRVGSAQAATLDAAEELACQVIAIPKTGTLLKVGWCVAAASSFVGTVKVSLETVAATAGEPVATTDSGKTLYAANAQSAGITSVSAGARFDAINGSAPATGISVTKGDLVAVTVRCTAFTSGSMGVGYDQYVSTAFGDRNAGLANGIYFATRLGGTWTVTGGNPILSLEYDTGIVPIPYATPASSATAGSVSWVSSTNPNRLGLKMTFPFGCKLRGVTIYGDIDQDTGLILYDSDGYSVMSGFPITLAAGKRKSTAAGASVVEFPTEPTLTANTAYRLVLLPSTTTPQITLMRDTPADDSAVVGMNGYVGGTSFVQTSFNGAPTSGSHAWTDTATIRPAIIPLVSQLDLGSADYPSESDVRSGVEYGSGTLTGTCAVPAAADVQDGVSVDATTGTFTAPAVGDVQAGVTFGGGGTEFEGTFAVPAEEDVESGVTYGAGGTEFTGTLSGGAADWTADEKAQIRSALGIDGTKTTATGGQLQALDTVADAIKLKTDYLPSEAPASAEDVAAAVLTAAAAAPIDANVQEINDVVITGNGQSGTKFGVA